MSIQVLTKSDGTLTIALPSRFDFSLHRAFHDAYRSVPSLAAGVRVDCRRVEYMDSSALGMLLLLQERAAEDSGEVTLVGCGEQVRFLLQVSKLDQLCCLPCVEEEH